MADKGTDPLEPLDNLEGNSSWFDSEALCIDALDSLDDLFEDSTNGSCISNLIDDTEIDQGNSLQLYNEQVTLSTRKTLLDLKRKLIKSPEQSVTVELSPRLAAVTISPRKKLVKRRLFDSEDSGLAEDETTNLSEKVDDSGIETETVALNANVSAAENREEMLLETAGEKYKFLAKFKENYGLKYSELVREFKSDKSCSKDWVVVSMYIAEELIEASKQLLQQECSYIQIICSGIFTLYVISFQCIKNRETVKKLLCKLLNCKDSQLVCDPPKTKSTPVALFFYRRTLGNDCFATGPLPDWIARQTLVSHQQATAETFKLSNMVQWAYDNNILNESEIAYRYACLADEDQNAAAFLQSNSQLKYVKDCCQMVRHYKRQEMNDMTMGEWILKCSEECKEEGDWRTIAKYFRYQGVNMIQFLAALKVFLQGRPKKNVLLIYGPPDTGKSYVCTSLIKFLHGKILSLQNKNSSFWLQPLADTKIGMIDDVTFQGFQHMDVYLRNALDGNPMIIDIKHRAPTQIKIPPIIMTSNIDINTEPSFKYLKSRITAFEFPNRLPFDDNDNLVYNINSGSWKSFFSHLRTHLELPGPEEQDESGRSESTFRCSAGKTNDYY